MSTPCRPPGRPPNLWGAGILLSLGVASLPALDLAGLEIHGFVSQGFMLSDDNNYLTESSEGSFEFTEIGLNVGGMLTDDLRFGVQVFSRDLGRLGNNELQLDWALFDYHWRDELGIRIGRVKMPIGLYNEEVDIDMGRTFVLLPTSVYGPSLRDVSLAVNGGQLYGFIDLSAGGSLDYQLFGGATNNGTDGSVGYILRDRGIEPRDMSSGEIYGGAFGWNLPVEGLYVKATILAGEWNGLRAVTPTALAPGVVYDAPTSIDFEDILALTVSLRYEWRDLVFATEYQTFDYDQTVLVDLTAASGPLVEADIALRSAGWYVSATWLYSERWQVGGYVSVSYNDRHERGRDGRTEDYAVAVRYDVNEHWIIKAEIHHYEGTSILNPALNPDGVEDSWNLLLLKTTVSF